MGIPIATSRAVVRIKYDDACAELSVVSGAHNIFFCRNMGLLIFTELLALPSEKPRPGGGWWEENSAHVSMFQLPHQASFRRKLQ